jgi:hypothetical protein
MAYLAGNLQVRAGIFAGRNQVGGGQSAYPSSHLVYECKTML